MSRTLKSIVYIIGGTTVGLAFLNVFQPSQSELEKIKKVGGENNSSYSAAVQVAATSKEPIYRQSSAQIQKQVMQKYKENLPQQGK